MTLEDIKNRKLTKKQLSVLTRVAQLQESGDDSGIDYSDIPQLTDEQLKQMVRLRDGRRKPETK
jgi:hypothetical protein